MLTPSSRLPLLPAALAALALALAPAAAAAEQGRAYVPGEVIVRYEPGVDAGPVQRETGIGQAETFAPHTRVLKIRDGETVAETVRELRDRPEVAAAAPNPIARISAYEPDDPGASGAPGGWQALQWNFLAEAGVNAPDAWEHLLQAGRPGGRGAVVAVLDTGVAYSNHGACPRTPDSSTRRRLRCRRSPDFGAGDFLRGYDFVRRDRRPNDENGHGTHVAGTIGEKTNNGVGLTGLAYGARILPVRVLNRYGEGDSVAISAGIRYAARRRADVINLSFEFGTSVTRDQIPDILEALRFARRKGVLVVAAAGNAAARSIAYPARVGDVLSVGATTQHLCQADYSNDGTGLDITAPGGGPDAAIDDEPNCRPLDAPGSDIFQMTFDGTVRQFGLPGGYIGTSMAAPHVSAAAALVIASGILGDDPSPRAIEDRLKATARDLGPVGLDQRYGAGLLDAARATDPGV